MIGLGVGGAAVIGLREARTGVRRRARLSGHTVIESGGGGASAALSGVVSGVKRLGDRMAIQDPAQLSTIRARMIQAGWFSREAVAVYLGAKAVALLLATIATILTVPWAISGGGGMGAILVAALFAGAAILGPDQVVKMRRRKLELENMDGFPDLLDLLVASVEAGLSLDAAVSRVGEELSRRYVHLGEHLRFLTLELRAGRSRKEAWSSFAERLAIDDARALATMLRQSEEMGTSLGDTLTVFSEDMRAKRMLRAEEKAMSLPAKLMVPLILFIFPCLMGVLILPAAYRISQTLMKSGGLG
ncbi:MAG: type II secretion system F family protein [Caulobacterales bacterium]|nr:type II secretion system F family protein [Caulobacterales bacterium]